MAGPLAVISNRNQSNKLLDTEGPETFGMNAETLRCRDDSLTARTLRALPSKNWHWIFELPPPAQSACPTPSCSADDQGNPSTSSPKESDALHFVAPGITPGLCVSPAKVTIFPSHCFSAPPGEKPSKIWNISSLVFLFSFF